MKLLDLHAWLAERKALVDDALAQRVGTDESAPANVRAAMRHATLSGGKRLRAILGLAVADVSQAPPESVLDAACGVELLHAASLVLDDLPSMDDASMRRGVPCTHAAFGVATALLAAMALVADAFALVTRNAVALERSERAAAAVLELSEAMGTRGIVGGQQLDLDLKGKAASLDQLEAVYRQKAAALFLASLRIPAILLGMPETRVEALTRFGDRLGLAFQITDDLLDAAHPSEDRGTATHVTHLGADGARARVGELVEDAVEALAGFGEAAEPLRLVAQHVRTRTV